VTFSVAVHRRGKQGQMQRTLHNVNATKSLVHSGISICVQGCIRATLCQALSTKEDPGDIDIVFNVKLTNRYVTD